MLFRAFVLRFRFNQKIHHQFQVVFPSPLCQKLMCLIAGVCAMVKKCQTDIVSTPQKIHHSHAVKAARAGHCQISGKFWEQVNHAPTLTVAFAMSNSKVFELPRIGKVNTFRKQHAAILQWSPCGVLSQQLAHIGVSYLHDFLMWQLIGLNYSSLRMFNVETDNLETLEREEILSKVLITSTEDYYGRLQEVRNKNWWIK